MIKYLALAAIALMISSINATAETLVDKAKKDKVVYVKRNDPAMLNAFKKAQETLDKFLAIKKAPGRGKKLFSIKVAIKDGTKTEYFWLTPFNVKGNVVEGQINNTPRSVSNVKNGQTVKIAKSEIKDWMYLDTEKREMVGNFTACAILKNYSKQQADEFKLKMGLKCTD